MNDEIKEILERVKKHYVLDEIQDNLLLDYITNLQQRIEKAVEYIKEDMYSEPNELYGLIDGEHLLNILEGKSDE